MAENNTYCSFLKRLSVFLNGFIAISGVALIGLGIYVKFKGAALTGVLGSLSPTNLLHVAHLCLLMGCSTMLLGLAGCYGTVRESTCILLFYFLVMAVIVTAEIIIATVVLTFLPTLKCCGVKNYTDFSSSSFEMRTGYTYPRSFCKSIGASACSGRDASPDIIYQEGCFPALLEITKTQSFRLSWGSLGAAVVQLPGTLAILLLFAELG